MKKSLSESISSLFSLKIEKGNDHLLASILKIREEERLSELKDVVRTICVYLSLPLYLFFWLCDIVFVPHLAKTFLLLRLTIVPVNLLINFINTRVTSYKSAQWNALALTFYNGLLINIMIYLMKDSSSPYYAGLNLVAIGSLAFLPWKSYFMWLTFLALYGPYYLIYFYLKEETPTALFLTNSFFILGTVFIAFVIRHFNENLRLREVKSRVKLEDEVEHRNEIIDQKTKQAVSLTNLSKQFSPQVVNSIENGKIKLEADVHRAKICSIFIDIVNSTERITRLEKDKVHKVISMFMEDTNKILLKYDITIDKFLGDGILAFCNDPIQYNDYAERVVRAALEIQERVRQRQFLYENYWLNQLELRMGIAIGDANVGFYGSQKYYHSYTAIGPVINLASRLCGAAKPNQIVMSYDVLEAINFEDYEIEPIGKLSLKGFEQDVINAYSLLGARKQNQVDVSECPTCGNIMHLEQNQKGIYIFVCRSCGSELDEKGTLESPYQKNSA